MKKTLIACMVLLFTSSCTKMVLEGPPLKYSFMPKYLDIDSIGPGTPLEESVIDSTLGDFKSMALDEGVLTTDYDTLYIPAGVLISDKKAAEYIFYKSGYERQGVMLKYSVYLSKEYYEKSLEAEKLYQQEIRDLRKKAERSWLEKNLGYIGLIAGLFTAVLTEIAIVKIAD